MTVSQVFVVSIFLLATTHLNLTIATSKNQTLYILTLLPYPYYEDQQFNPSWSDGPQVSIALELAKEQINNQTAILPDYNIELISGDTGCEYLDRAYEAIGSKVYYPGVSVNPVGIIGPGCSTSSLEVSTLTSREELSLVTVHGGGSPLLSDRTNFPYSLGTLGSAGEFSNLTIELMRMYKWERIGILYFDIRQFYYSTARTLNEMLLNLNDSTLSSGFFSPVYDETYIPLEDIMTRGLRINIIFSPPNTTQRILCLAMSRGMVYPAYQWIVTSNTFDEIAVDVSFMLENQFYNCSAEEMKMTVLNRALFFNYQLFHINQTQPSTFSQYSFKEYDNLIQKKFEEYNMQENVTNVTYSVWTTYFYDSLWAWSVVLDRVTKRVPELDLTQYRYENTLVTNMFLNEFYGLDFEGVSGRIKFDNESGFLPRIISVFQVIDGVEYEVAYFDGKQFYNQNSVYTLDSIEGEFPNQFYTIDLPICVILLITIFIEFIGVIIIHALTVKYRKYQSVKASSSKLSQLTFIGMYLLLFTMFIHVLQHYFEFDKFTAVVLCNMTWGWLLPISFTLMFGTVAVRTWRLYRIFTHYLNPGRFIADHYLVVFVFIMVGVDVLLGTLWGTIDPQRVGYQNDTIVQGPKSFKIIARQCSNTNLYWPGLILGYQAIIIITVLVLTFLTRKITNQSFRTKTLRVLVYLSSLVLVVGFLLYYLLLLHGNPFTPASFITLWFVFNILMLLFMFLIGLPPLVPKLRQLYLAKIRSS